MQSANIKFEQDFQYPSVARRLLCTIAYSLGIFAGISVLGVLIVSPECQLDGKCSNRDRIVDMVLSGLWLVGSLLTGYKAWRGELAGCRKKVLT